MWIDVLWCINTIQFAHNLANGERHSAGMLYKNGKEQSHEGFVNGSTGSTQTEACFIEKALAKVEVDTLCRNKMLGLYSRIVFQNIH